MSNSQFIPEDMRNGFAGAEIIGTLAEDIEQWQANWLRDDNALRDDEVNLEIEVNSPPIMLCSEEIREAYANSNYDEIKNLEKLMQHDLESIDENVRQNGEKAFRKVKQGFYLASNKHASVWIYPREVEETVSYDDKGERQSILVHRYQVGKYTSSGHVTGTIEYKFRIGSFKISGILAAMVAKLMQTALKQGTKILINNLVAQLVSFAEEKGVKLVPKITKGSVTGFVGATLFAFVFVGLDSLWNWANRRYTVILRVFNWSPDQSLYISDGFLRNVEMLCNEQTMDKRCEAFLPKTIPLGSQILPPGFAPKTPIDAISYYVTYFFENDVKFLEGCGIAFKMEIGAKGSTKGFYYAFDCPRLAANRQKAEANSGYENSKQYYDKAPWNANPLKFSFQAENIPVSVTLDALSGNDAFFHPVVNFNRLVKE